MVDDGDKRRDRCSVVYSLYCWLSSSWLFSWLRWKPTSMAQLAQAELKVLKHIKGLYNGVFVPICGNQYRIWTITLQKQDLPQDLSQDRVDKVPLVLVHGFGGGVAIWSHNLKALAAERTVHAFDLLGFGRSSRPHFSQNAHIAELEFIESIEEWREKMNLDRFILLGHSFGAYLSCSYAIKYPKKVKQLILVDPWGFPEKPSENSRNVRYNIPVWVRMMATLLKPFNPLAGLRMAGPWGPYLVAKFRPDFRKKYDSVVEDSSAILNYIYHCNAQTPSGETAFKNMSIPFGWAKRPMLHRIRDVHLDIPISMIYGAKSWMDKNSGHMVEELRSSSQVDIQVIKGAGHHVFADKPDQFNEIVKKMCNCVDEQ